MQTGTCVQSAAEQHVLRLQAASTYTSSSLRADTRDTLVVAQTLTLQTGICVPSAAACFGAPRSELSSTCRECREARTREPACSPLLPRRRRFSPGNKFQDGKADGSGVSLGHLHGLMRCISRPLIRCVSRPLTGVSLGHLRGCL